MLQYSLLKSNFDTVNKEKLVYFITSEKRKTTENA